MTDDQNQKYIYYTKVAWAIYALIIFLLIVVLVLFIADDNEERLFFTLMTAAAAYVFRPTERFFSRKIFKYTGVSKPTNKD